MYVLQEAYKALQYDDYCICKCNRVYIEMKRIQGLPVELLEWLYSTVPSNLDYSQSGCCPDAQAARLWLRPLLDFSCSLPVRCMTKTV